jgi:hypothetical protein
VPIIFTDRTKRIKIGNSIIVEALFWGIRLKLLIVYNKKTMNRVLIKNAKIVNEG